MTASLAPINRSCFALVMGVATACALGVGLMLAAQTGAPEGMARTLIGVVIVVAGAMSMVALLGRSILKDEYWGMAVLAVSAFRTLVAMGAMLLLIELWDLPRKPVVYALLAATLILTAAEACAAVWLLQKRESARLANKLVAGPGNDVDGPSSRSGELTPVRRSM